MYLAAGVAAGNAAPTDWDTLLAERIFEPLGMTSANSSCAQSQADPRLSLGYIWDEDLKVHKHLPTWAFDNIRPAGAITSNVRDMAQWVRFQLGFGAYDSDRLLSETSTRRPGRARSKSAEETTMALAGSFANGMGSPSSSMAATRTASRLKWRCCLSPTSASSC